MQNDIHHDLYADVSYIIYVDPICIGKQYNTDHNTSIFK